MQYEITVENITPCGGEKYARREILEAEADSPMDYVAAHKLFPDVRLLRESEDETVIVASNPAGYQTRYTFTR